MIVESPILPHLTSREIQQFVGFTACGQTRVGTAALGCPASEARHSGIGKGALYVAEFAILAEELVFSAS
jgi:hypothetical protein